MKTRISLGGGARGFLPLKGKSFTLSEVLITLGIIGIVAAITLPALINKIDDRQYRVARQKMHYTMREGLRSIAAEGLTGDYVDAKDFVENELKKRVKIIKTCDNDNLRACGIETGTGKIFNILDVPITMPRQIKDLYISYSNGNGLNGEDKSYGFILSNGYSVNLFYNPKCQNLKYEKDLPYISYWQYITDVVCVNLIYDMNGLSKPNKVGKDIGFVTMVSPGISTQVAAPDVFLVLNRQGATFTAANKYCTNIGKGYTMPTLEELIAAAYNGDMVLGKTAGGGSFWASNHDFGNQALMLIFYYGYFGYWNKSTHGDIMCVRR